MAKDLLNAYSISFRKVQAVTSDPFATDNEKEAALVDLEFDLMPLYRKLVEEEEKRRVAVPVPVPQLGQPPE